MTYSFCQHSVPVGFTQPLIRVPRDLFGDEGRPARRADISAVVVLPNFKVRMEVQLSIRPVSLLDLLGKAFNSGYNFGNIINSYAWKFPPVVTRTL